MTTAFRLSGGMGNYTPPGTPRGLPALAGTCRRLGSPRGAVLFRQAGYRSALETMG